MWRSLAVGIVLMLSGCALKPQIDQASSIYLTLKTPLVRLSDFAFVRQSFLNTNVQVLNAGKVVLDMRIATSICLNGPCYDKRAFNRRFFGDAHYPELLEEILAGVPIYEGKNKITTDEGFAQEISRFNRTLLYEATPTQTVFRDPAQGILIKITHPKGEL
jgi:hypothetical protein